MPRKRRGAAQAQTIKRNGLPADLTGAIAFLTSDDAAVVTGRTITADGGCTR